MTIYEVSKRAGVSIATISRALNPHTQHKVAAETLRRIDSVIRRCGYVPNVAARHLGGAPFKTIGLLMTHFHGLFSSDYHTSVLSGVADALLGTEYTFRLVLLKPISGHWDRYNFHLGEGLDGMIVTHWPNFFSKASALEAASVPCVVINDPEPNVRAHFFGGDNVRGGGLAARYLHAHGHRNIAVLTGPSWSSDSRQRIAGFKRSFTSAGGHTTLTILPCDFSLERARLVTEAFFRTPKASVVTAVFCCNDNMALGVLDSLRRLRIACPKKVSVMGYDDDRRARETDPPLSTIRVPVYDIAKAGAERLVQHLQEGTKRPLQHGQTVLPVELVARSSVHPR